MKWASGISERAVAQQAILELAAHVRAELGGAEPDLAILFVSPHHAATYARIPSLLQAALPRALIVGCSAGGVIGGGLEIEGRPALSITAASLPGVELQPFHFEADSTPPDEAAWRARFGDLPDATFLVFPDPFTADVEELLSGLDEAYPTLTKLGGLASGGTRPGANALFLGDAVHRSGSVGVALSGNLMVDTIVAQGCRTIGKPLIVSRCEENVILELDHRRPVDVLKELYSGLDERDQELFKTSLFVGIEMREGMEFNAGEFLVRNMAGVDTKRGAIAVGALLTPWQVVQFLLRDARTAEDDLERMLARYRAEEHGPVRGVLMFSCMGRGEHLFGRADHDTGLFAERLGPAPLGGFFCSGEIGPVGGQTFVHGYTSAFGVFREKSHGKS
jgi:small ligand-binding sensory domain FIST